MKGRRHDTALPLALAVGLGLSLAHAAPGEVQNLRFDAAGNLAWDATAGATGYHVYYERISALPDYGVCLLGSVQGTTADVDAAAGDPSPGEASFFLATAFDASGESTAGFDHGGLERFPTTPCVPARRFLPLTANGAPAADAVVDGEEPRRNPSAETWSSRRETTGVYLHSGEFFLSATDLAIPGRGMDFRFTRKYRSQISHDGPLGHGWDFNFNARLASLGSDVIFHDGSGRREIFQRIDTTHFESPPGLYAVLREQPDGSFRLRWPDGTIMTFHALTDGTNVQGALESVEDRLGRTADDPVGNRTSLLYDHQGLLVTLVDTLGRSVDFDYDANGRITALTDFSGRAWGYAYDAAGNLTSATSPAVTGTPNGNDFPTGKTTTYAYSGSLGDPILQHNLLRVHPPVEGAAGTPTVENTYDTTPGSFSQDRVISQVIGGSASAGGPPAGGTLTYGYASLDPCDTSPPLTQACRQTTLVDRNGNRSVHTVNVNGHVLSKVEETNRDVRAGEPDYTTELRYSAEGELRCTILPRGNGVVYTYDVPASPPLRLDRYREGNLLEVRRVGNMGTSGDCPTLGAATDIVQTYTYEPIYNLLASSTEPRGNDATYVPQNGGAASAARYTTSFTYDYQEGDPALNGINAYAAEHEIDLTGASLNLGDVNGNNDGRSDQISGVVVRRDDPTVTLLAGSNQAAIEGDLQQEIVTLHVYDNFSQLIETADAEGNHHTFAYFPENDPDGDGTMIPPPDDGRFLDPSIGGYLKTRTLDTQTGAGRNNGTDPPATAIRHDLEYDEVGNVVATIDGRGIKTRRVYNALNQVVELRRGAATADGNGPPGYADPDLATGRGETGLIAPGFLVRFEYDANDNLVARQFEDRNDDRQAGTCGFGGCVEDRLAYDLLDNLVQVERDASATATLATRLRYDPNQNHVLSLRPEGNDEGMVFDERDLPAEQTRGATSPPALALMDPADPATFDPRGGTPSTVLYRYDGNGNLDQLTDGRGNASSLTYDLFDRRKVATDQVGNTTEWFYDPASNVVRVLRRGPVDGSGAGGNVDLADSDLLYDELNRLFRRDDDLFVPMGASPARTPSLTEGSLVPADGAINTVHEHDRLSRRTFHVADTEATTRYDYDGAGRIARRTDRGGNTVEFTYDGSHNLVESLETETSSVAGPPDEQFFTTHFYDALQRRTMTTDNIGRTWRYYYDSQDALITLTDPRGPAGGMIQRRTPGHTGVMANVNDDGNVTELTHDGAGRRLTTVHVLTASGEGDGTLTPTPDPTQSGDGKITLTTTWDLNSLVMQRQDDLLNTTSYAYDNLNRRIGITSDDGTTTSYQYDANDNVVMKTDANGSRITRTYDAANRLTSAGFDRANGVPGVADIEGTTEQTFEYDGLNRLTRATDDNDPDDETDNVTTTLIYDSLSRLIEERSEISDGSAAANTDYSWTGHRLLTQLRYPDSGLAIDYAYDATSDLLTGINDAAGTTSTSYRYFGLNRLHTVDYGNGARRTWLNDAGDTDVGYDGARRTVQMRYVVPGTTFTLLAGFEYGYDGASNLLGQRRLHDPKGPDLEGELYRYDSANRLLSFEEGPIAPGASLGNTSTMLTGTADDAWSFVLDGASNWPEMTRGVGAAAKTFRATPNNLNEYDEAQSGGTRTDDGVADDFKDDDGTAGADGLNHSHDKTGNLTDVAGAGAGAPMFELRYDALGRLVRVFDPSDDLGVYAYDALGRRVKRTTTEGGASETRRYSYAGTNEIEERDDADSVVRQVANRSASDLCLNLTADASVGNCGRSGVGAAGCNPPDDNRCGAAVYPDYDSWQVRTGSTEYLMPDITASTIGIMAQAPATVLERVTYDAWGVPTFENASNEKLCGDSSPVTCSPTAPPFMTRSQYGNPNLFRRLRHDPETGARTNDPVTDQTGLYLAGKRYFDPNRGRAITRAGAGGWADRGRLGNSYVMLNVGRRQSADGALAVRDVPCGGGDEAWCSLLAVGYRGGGAGVMMLDVTEPSAPHYGHTITIGCLALPAHLPGEKPRGHGRHSGIVGADILPDQDGCDAVPPDPVGTYVAPAGWTPATGTVFAPATLAIPPHPQPWDSPAMLAIPPHPQPWDSPAMLAIPPHPQPWDSPATRAIPPHPQPWDSPASALIVGSPHAYRFVGPMVATMPQEFPELPPPKIGADFGETEGSGDGERQVTSLSGPIAIPPPDDDDDDP